MNRNALRWMAVILALLLVGGAGYWFGRAGKNDAATTIAADTNRKESSEGNRKVLYWYDPMYPQRRFDAPGNSPFMDMALIPKYADEDGGGAGVRIDPLLAQNLGVRFATVEAGRFAPSIDAAANVGFNERDVAIIQARTAGFVERVYDLAPGDLVAEGASIADVLVPEWTGAQREFLTLRSTGNAELTAAALERLKLLGMPSALIERVERTNESHPLVTITAPTAGVIQALDIRTGMTVAPGMTLARINGLSTVWLEAAVPEAQAGALAPGAVVEARLSAFPGETFKGRIAAILPEANAQTRTLRVRAEFPNRAGRLKPGLYAQMRIALAPQRDALLVPSEAVIRTGKRTLVIVADADNRFQPVEIEPGAEADGKTAVLKGLRAGQKVVVSGQFLIDSEASLKGATGRMEEAGADTPAPVKEERK
jgi:Cu(I)/Ag(I) efflux system membrane fusion protein